MIKVLIVDDHHVVRDGIKRLLQDEAEFEVSGEASNGQEALDLLTNGTEADIVLADVSMPKMDGLELAKAIGNNFQNLKVVLLTMHEDDCFVQQAFDNGITNYVFKTANPEELIFALRQAYAQKSYLCSSLADQLIKRSGVTGIPTKAVNTTGVEFSSRELDVLQLIADGYSNEEAANKLFTSRRTVEGHRQSMIDKTGSRNSLALVRFAMRNGLLE